MEFTAHHHRKLGFRSDIHCGLAETGINMQMRLKFCKWGEQVAYYSLLLEYNASTAKATGMGNWEIKCWNGRKEMSV